MDRSDTLLSVICTLAVLEDKLVEDAKWQQKHNINFFSRKQCTALQHKQLQPDQGKESENEHIYIHHLTVTKLLQS